MAGFEHQVADRLLALQAALRDGSWQPGPYVHFKIHSPKTRLISAAPFADRVVHHALCNVMVPLFEPGFDEDSYANRTGKGTHRAVDRFQQLAQRHQYALRLDIVRHFPSIDHEVLVGILARRLTDPGLLSLAARIIGSGNGILEQEYAMVYFPGDDLLAALRPRGLPIGNLTSQFWSNCYMNPLDQFIRRELRCSGYVRYVDDMTLFSNSKNQLWEWKAAIVERLQRLRLTLHGGSAQVMPSASGVPWLGFVVHPTHRLLRARKAVEATRHLGERFGAWQSGAISLIPGACGGRCWGVLFGNWGGVRDPQKLLPHAHCVDRCSNRRRAIPGVRFLPAPLPPVPAPVRIRPIGIRWFACPREITVRTRLDAAEDDPDAARGGPGRIPLAWWGIRS